MNTLLRQPRVFSTIINPATGKPRTGTQAKLPMVKKSAEFVYIGDGISLDQTGEVPSQVESGRFAMETSDLGEAYPALRHNDGANILFVDGHVNLEKHATIERAVTGNPTLKIKTWEAEYIDAAGNPVDPTVSYNASTMQPTTLGPGVRRNPKMPLIWSDPPKIYK